MEQKAYLWPINSFTWLLHALARLGFMRQL
jgi:hypothetical protein